MSIPISVIIPSWNGKKYLETCLDSLQDQTFKDFETILVDNGSEDNTISFVNKHYPFVKIIALEKNFGFSGAVNKAIGESKGNYLALLNNDTEVHPDWLKELYKSTTTFASYWLFASKILCFDRRDTIDNIGEILRENGTTSKAFHHRKDGQKANVVQEVFGPSATACLYKRELFNRIGFFDEDFFIGYDDADFHFRAQLAGFRCLYIPSAKVYHIGHGTADFQSLTMRYLMFRNENYFIFKNIPTLFFLKYFKRIALPRLWWLLKDSLKLALKYKVDDGVRIRVNAWKEIAINSKNLLRKRRMIQKQKVVRLAYLESLIEGTNSF